MNQSQSYFHLRDTDAVMNIHVEFGDELPISFPIKIQPYKSMKNPLSAPEKPVVPTLFDISPRPGELALKRAPGVSQMTIGEMMLNAKKVEAILKAIVQRKKTPRRVSTSRIEKQIAFSDRWIA